MGITASNEEILCKADVFNGVPSARYEKGYRRPRLAFLKRLIYNILYFRTNNISK
jgi:hypothetical protein